MVKRIIPAGRAGGEPVKRQTFNTDTATPLGSHERSPGHTATLYEGRTGQLFLHMQGPYREPEKAGKIQHAILPLSDAGLKAYCKEWGLDWHKRKPAPADTSTTLYVRMPKSLKAKIDAEAKRLRQALKMPVSVNELVSKRLETAFDKDNIAPTAYALASALRICRGEEDGDLEGTIQDLASIALGLDSDELDKLAAGSAVELRGVTLKLKFERESRKDLH